MLPLVIIFYQVFGAFTLLGGLIGFIKAKSRASLIAGVISSAFLFASAFLLVHFPATPSFGLGLGLFITLALLGRFLPAYLKQRKMMPAGMISMLGAISLVLTLQAFFQK